MPDSQTLGLFIAATLAGVVCFRLYWILGRRTGHEPTEQPKQPSPLSAPTPVAQPGPVAADVAEPVPPSANKGLMDIQLADRSFDAARFVGGAQQAYTMIIDAFAKGDRDTLRPLLAPDVMAAFDSAIEGRSEPPRSWAPRWKAARPKSPSPSRRSSMPRQSPMCGPSRATSNPAIPTGS
jgi:hypothetical protein